MSKTKLDKHREISNELYNIYKAKNADYGDSFGEMFNKFGMASSVIRLTDKIKRLEALTLKTQIEVKDESIQDTLKDMANYAIMTLIELQK